MSILCNQWWCFRAGILASLLGFSFSGPALAAGGEFDPEQACESVLTNRTGAEEIMVGAWISGYLAKAEGRLEPVNIVTVIGNIQDLQSLCDAQPGAQFSELVNGLVKTATVDPNLDITQSGRQVLLRFFEPGADHAALTAALKPSPEDVRAVYAEPLASQLIENYDALYQPGTAIRPKLEQTELITFFSTTAALQSGDPMLDEFPGGYKKVLPHFVSDVPIVRFKFVKSGERSGISSDGFIFVNDRWVFMPKPWRSLP